MQMRVVGKRASWLVGWLAVVLPAVVLAEVPRAVPKGKQPADKRLDKLTDLNGYFPLRVPRTRQAWQRRAERVRRQTRVALGIWPLPKATPLKPVIHGRLEQPDYTVEKVYFESMPGFFVTGNLYRPAGKPGKRPAVLCPHGHWSGGRFYDAGEKQAQDLIKSQAERFVAAARNHIQARCVHLARMGCVVFQYDMIGYADNSQVPYGVSHRQTKQRPHLNTTENWGLFTAQAETHLQSIPGLQTYNSIRALDFVSQLPDVDPKRIGVTGASGGGTQTFLLCAVDPRPTVAFPAVMASTAMQGGCTCENASLLRVGTGNIELTALMAPRPLGLSAANDWTKEMSTKGFPELQALYRLLEAPHPPRLISRLEFGHNFNQVSRAAMYALFKEHLKLDADAPLAERDFPRRTAAELTVWDKDHPKPPSGEDFERKLLRYWHEDAQRQLAGLKPNGMRSYRNYRQVVGGAVDVLIGRRLPKASGIEWVQGDKIEKDGYVRAVGLLNLKPRGESLPVLFLFPKQWEGQVAIWIHPRGKAGMYGADDKLDATVQQLLDAGVSVAGVDLFQQGEFLADGKPLTTVRRVPNNRISPAYTFGYNHSLFARRVHDVLTMIAFVRNHEYTPEAVHLIGLHGAGHWVAAARAQAGNAVDKAIVDTAGFRFGKLTDVYHPHFLPGGAKYHDLPGMLSLSAPDPLWITGEQGELPAVVRATYEAAEAPDKVVVDDGPAKQSAAAAVEWLLDE